MKCFNLMTSCRFGRVLLHLSCALRRPSHWCWHWQGIQRELPFSLQFNGWLPCKIQRGAS